MDEYKLRSWLAQVQNGELSIDQMIEKLRILPYEDLGYAQLDLHRALRTGQPEVVFCQSKTVEQVATIFERLAAHHNHVLGTRASPEQAATVQKILPAAVYDNISRLLQYNQEPPRTFSDDEPYILVACAGTADLPVAQEASQTAEFLGSRVLRAYDVGVAGLHRLLGKMEILRAASVVISVAGMEGALTSVIGGLTACPVIGVPTSVGYGANYQGLSALLAMLNACAPGVSVVNIDNGFGAGYVAHRILQVNKTTHKKE